MEVWQNKKICCSARETCKKEKEKNNSAFSSPRLSCNNNDMQGGQNGNCRVTQTVTIQKNIEMTVVMTQRRKWRSLIACGSGGTPWIEIKGSHHDGQRPYSVRQRTWSYKNGYRSGSGRMTAIEHYIGGGCFNQSQTVSRRQRYGCIGISRYDDSHRSYPWWRDAVSTTWGGVLALETK